MLVCDNGLSQEISKIYKVKPGYTEVIKTKEKRLNGKKNLLHVIIKIALKIHLMFSVIDLMNRSNWWPLFDLKIAIVKNAFFKTVLLIDVTQVYFPFSALTV